MFEAKHVVKGKPQNGIYRLQAQSDSTMKMTGLPHSNPEKLYK
ncbi:MULTISPECIES: hypothetical protein [unclassified Acinetobacter]|nr:MULTISPECIES: hypothetical protein [unclassified Acinetobacter]